MQSSVTRPIRDYSAKRPKFPGGRSARRVNSLHSVVPIACALIALTFLLVGCGFHDDPGFNPYLGPGVQHGLWDSVDDLHNLTDQGLDNFDRRMENILY